MVQALSPLLAFGMRRDMSEWISVKERLPEYGVEVLAAFKGQFRWIMFVSEMHHGKLSTAGYAAPEIWQPLPEPPKEQP